MYTSIYDINSASYRFLKYHYKLNGKIVILLFYKLSIKYHLQLFVVYLLSMLKDKLFFMSLIICDNGYIFAAFK